MNKNTIKAPCTILLAAVNVIVFLVLSFLGMTEDGEFIGLFPVVVTNKIARSCTDNTHDQGHDHFDRGHRVHSPLF